MRWCTHSKHEHGDLFVIILTRDIEIGKHHRDDHLHLVEGKVIDSRTPTNHRPVSPSGWSFRSKGGSTKGGGGDGASIIGRNRVH